MNDPEYFRNRARQCRRLMWGIGDRATIKALEALAAEFDAKAAAILSMAIGSQLKNITLRGNDDPASILETDNDADDDNAG